MSSVGPSSSRLSNLSTYQSTSISRLKSLYSDFIRQKQSNPTSYASNVEWWRRTLEGIVLNGWQSRGAEEKASVDRLVLHAAGPSLTDIFRFEGVGKPLSLAGVIMELCETKAYFPLPSFLSATQSIYDPGWLPYRIASYVVGKPLWWALQQLNVISPDEGGQATDIERWRKVKGDYVVLGLLERAAAAILHKQKSKNALSLADSLYKFDGFQREFADSALEGVVLSDLDLKVVLKFMERDKRVIAVQGEVIKFLDIDMNEAPITEITAVDTGILELKTGVENLQGQVDAIQTQIDQRSEKINTALRQKRREVALSHLRSRKLLDDLLRKRLSSLDILQSALIRVETAAGDVEIMRSYETSTATLRAVLAHPLLQREKIDETMEAMASANADAQEIDDAIHTGVDIAQQQTGIDESDLEAELQNLVEEVESQRAKEEQTEGERRLREKLATMKLDVPGHDPMERTASEEAWTDNEADEDFRTARVRV